MDFCLTSRKKIFLKKESAVKAKSFLERSTRQIWLTFVHAHISAILQWSQKGEKSLERNFFVLFTYFEESYWRGLQKCSNEDWIFKLFFSCKDSRKKITTFSCLTLPCKKCFPCVVNMTTFCIGYYRTIGAHKSKIHRCIHREWSLYYLSFLDSYNKGSVRSNRFFLA